MSNTHLAKKKSGDNTSVCGTQAVSASYKTHTKCLNNQWVTVNTMHEMIIIVEKEEKSIPLTLIYFDKTWLGKASCDEHIIPS
jgi:hypothetical protein